MTYQENQNIPRTHPGHGQGPAGASLSDLLTAVKNVAAGISNLAQTYLNVQGQQTRPGINGASGPALVKSGAGRIAQISVVVSGGGPAATLVDAAVASATSPVIYVAPSAIGLYQVNLPFTNGLVVIPGAGDTVTVSFS